MGMSRTLNRSMARREYARFARKWREDLRQAGLYGKPNSPKRPRFQQWYAMQQFDVMREPVGKYVEEQLSADIDPWQDPAGTHTVSNESERGVVTMDIVGTEDEE